MNRRLYALDAMRGICAVALMFYHYIMWNGTDYFQIGYFGVYVFFMLSGFSMWYVYSARALDIRLLREFFAARVARILPLYFVMTLVGGAARLAGQGSGSLNLDFLQRLVLNATLLFGLSIPGKSSFIPGGWSIGIEWVFYLAFPLLLMFSCSLRTMVLLLVASFLLNQVVVVAVLSQGPMAQQWNAYTNFPTFIVYFIAGICMAKAYARLQDNPARFHWVRSPVLCRLVPLASLAFMFTYPSPTQEAYLQGPHVALLIALGMAGILFASFLQPAAWEQQFYRFLGDISYSIYLVNFFVYEAVTRLLKHACPGCGLTLMITLSAAASFALAYCSYRFYEMPARLWINRKLGHHISR